MKIQYSVIIRPANIESHWVSQLNAFGLNFHILISEVQVCACVCMLEQQVFTILSPSTIIRLL